MIKTYRKWGYYQVLLKGKIGETQWKLKKLVVFPGEKTSLQRHFLRSEFWLDDKGGTHIIEVGRWHQLSNSTTKKRCIIEIQYGKKCIEEDIERKSE